MQNFMKTILSAVKNWTKKELNRKAKDSVADWNQNDPGADNYVKNRTHWDEEKILVDCLTKTDYEAGNFSGCTFTDGTEYVVTFNDRTYENLVCYTDGDFHILVSTSDGYDFYVDDDGGDGLYIEYDGDWEISITELVPHKLNKKYLDIPENVATVDDVQEVANTMEEVANTMEELLRNTANELTAEINTKMDKTDPVGIGSLSMNHKADSAIGEYSTAFGYAGSATRKSQFVAGEHNIEENAYTITTITNYRSIDIYTGYDRGIYYASDYRFNSVTLRYELVNPTRLISQSPGDTVSKYYVLRNKYIITVTANEPNSYYMYYLPNVDVYQMSISHYGNTVRLNTTVDVIERYDIKDLTSTRGEYANIVGNGTSDKERSNAYTLDWSGVGWYQGGLQVGGNAQDDGAKNVLLEGDAIPVPAIAQVGQLLSVKAVDETGKPTEWETIDIADYVNQAVANAMSN